jgi:hypothetical protein
MSNWLEVRIPISPRADYFNRVRLIAHSIRSLGGRYADVRIRVTVGADREPEDLRALLPWSDAAGVTWHWVERSEFRAWAGTSHAYIATMMERFRPPFDADNILMLDADVVAVRPFDELMSRLERRPAVAGMMAHVSPFGDAPAPNRVAWQERQGAGTDAPASNHIAWWRHLFQIAGMDPPAFDQQLSGWGVMTNDPGQKMSPAYFNTGVILAPSRLLERLHEPYTDALSLVRSALDNYFFEQIALTLALYRAGIPFDVLPLRYNFPNQAGFDASSPEDLSDLCFLHFLRDDVVSRERDFESLDAMAALAARTDLVGSNEAFRRRVAQLLPLLT